MKEMRLYLRKLARDLAGYAFRYGSEVQLHERIADALTQLGVAFSREVAVDDKNRFDFQLENGCIIEVKVRESLSPAIRQVARYAALESVKGILLAGTQHWDLGAVGPNASIASKPLVVCRLRRQSV